jgi:tripartite-type tricarboxylate transporter receptor subunit TctC
MKRLLITALASLSLTASAGELVPIVWPFATGANQANFIRVIVEQANKEQSKYTFYYDNKPGAGGTIAARYVQDHKGIAILSSSSSYWIRPEFYPNESYKTSDFKPVMIECVGQPYSLVSAKYKSLEEIRKEKILNIGVILGSLTEANAREVQTLLPDTKLNFIPFNGTLVSTQEMIAGRLDLNIDLPAELKQWTDLGTVHVIGASGTKSYPGLPTWDSQGIKGFGGLVSNYQMVVSDKVNEKTRKELHAILRRAATDVVDLPVLYERDRCTGVSMDYKETNATYEKWSAYWPKKLQGLLKVNNE